MSSVNSVSYISYPRVVHLTITKSCNWGCIFCYQSKEKLSFERNISLSLKNISKIIERIADAGVKEITLYGGEITLLKNQWLKIARIAYQKGLLVGFISNGELLSDINDIQLQKIQEIFYGAAFSIHGLASIHDLIVRKSGSFNKTVETIRKLYFSGIKIVINVTVCTYNLFYIEELLRFISSRFPGVPIFINRAINHRKSNSNPPFLNKNEIIKMLKIIKFLKEDGIKLDVAGGVPIPPCILDESLKKYAMYCSAGFDFADIDAEGNVYMCPESSKPVGNILKQELIDIWNAKIMRDFRSLSWLHSKCKDCSYLDSCWGGCKADETIDYIATENESKTYYVVNPLLTVRSIDNLFAFSLPDTSVYMGSNLMKKVVNSLNKPKTIEEITKYLGISLHEINELVGLKIILEIYRDKMDYYNPFILKKLKERN